MAEATRNRSLEVLQEMKPIGEQVEQWAQNMRNNQYSTQDYERAVSSAGDAGTRTAMETLDYTRLDYSRLDYCRLDYTRLD